MSEQCCEELGEKPKTLESVEFGYEEPSDPPRSSGASSGAPVPNGMSLRTKLVIIAVMVMIIVVMAGYMMFYTWGVITFFDDGREMRGYEG